jgi:hypothetical protein
LYHCVKLDEEGEWLLDAGNSFGQVDLRLMLRPDDGVHIDLRHRGIMDFNEVGGDGRMHPDSAEPAIYQVAHNA